jgi:hypothetical protein
METITLTLTDLGRLKTIQKNLKGLKELPITQQAYLYQFLSQIPTNEAILANQIDNATVFLINVWDNDKLRTSLAEWQTLLGNLPGVDRKCRFVRPDDLALLHENVIIVAPFAPSLSYHLAEENEPFELRLRDDGTALFWLPNLDSARQYPELLAFKGTWKEATLLLIETMRSGWPVEPLPDELRELCQMAEA